MQQLMRIQIKSQTTCLVLIMEIEYKETKVRVEHCVCEHYHLVESLQVWVFVSVKEVFFRFLIMSLCLNLLCGGIY